MPKKSLLQQSDDDDEERIRKLLLWAKSRHIWIHEDAQVGRMECPEKLESRSRGRSSTEDDDGDGDDDAQSGSSSEEEHEQRAKGEGFGVYVKNCKRILERQVVVLVPKSTMLSARTSSLAPHLPPHMIFSSDATSGLLLTLVLMHEFLLGQDGPWWGYLQSLPRTEGLFGLPLPLSTSKASNDWKWMDKTEVGRMVRRAESDPQGRIEGLGMSAPRLRSFFKHKGLAILKKAHHHHHKFDDDGSSKHKDNLLLEEFIRLNSIISSRTFIVDMYHGMCLVPIADMFNHSEYSNMHFEADDEVCDECGSLGTCPHNEDPLPSSAYGRPSAFLPAQSGPNSANWNPPKELQDIDTVDMVAQSYIRGQEEAYNTYGNFSNANLLTTYGFCLDYDTEWDRYTWEWRHKEEREEIFFALSYSSPSSSSSIKATRPREEEQQEENRRKSTWVKTCMQFTGLPLDSFGELLDDVSMGSQPAATSSSVSISENGSKESTMVRLPVSSPFVALTRPVWEEEGEGEEEVGEEDKDAKEDEEVSRREAVQEEGKEPDGFADIPVEDILPHFLADLSTHDGSKDKYQPLFIESRGYLSIALWRCFLLATISGSTREEEEEEEEDPTNGMMMIIHIVKKVERRLAVVMSHVGNRKGFDTFSEVFQEQDPTATTTTTSPDKYWEILRSTLQALLRLVRKRLSEVQMLRSQSVGEEENVSDLAIREWEPSLRRSAAIQASQELAALSSCEMLMTQYTQAISSLPGFSSWVTI